MEHAADFAEEADPFAGSNRPVVSSAFTAHAITIAVETMGVGARDGYRVPDVGAVKVTALARPIAKVVPAL